ncbi:hypothetical protein AGDE_15481 [Angomonas deanei]|uniref:Uncharacterized protein n=1 Tax=Angomonas deanei TaxID=59799 RepID=A0A7G2C483_9TRYP|nr:hypothetical protein AGDE_15481 [Angomonas deanei]CAD2214409.1 hypothetical protein, conserved [Angomonas deanei]|eukprot:EPY18981.1 hypothetical protein AGDE_15481 [Angomonas deanei]
MSYRSVLFTALLLTISLCRGEDCYVYGCANCTKDGVCMECEEGYYMQFGLFYNFCFPMVDNCDRYPDYGAGCSQCREGYLLSEYGMSCDLPIPNCDRHRSSGPVCEECCCGLVTSPDALSCVNRTTVEHCVRYQLNSVRCEECSDGLTISEDGLHCHNCSTVEHCKYCDASNRCTRCGRYRYTTGNTEVGTDYKFLNDTDGNQACVENIDGCQAYAHNGTCTECVENYVLQGNTCIYSNYSKCISRDMYGRCEACEGGLEVSTNRYSCVRCNVKGCLSCYRNDMCGEYLSEDSGSVCDVWGNCFELEKPDPKFSLLAAVIVGVVVFLVLLCCVRCCACLARRRRGDETQALLV